MTSSRGAQRADKRAHTRAPVEIPVSCERPDAAPVSGIARDIGVGGVFIESTEPVQFGTAVVVVGRLPGTSHDARLPGIVRWSKSNGFGVQFGLLGAQETYAILATMKG
jgi:hypothetical protein